MTLKMDAEAWSERKGIIVLDADGWDRSNYQASWAEEITEQEFDSRVLSSTIMDVPKK